MKKKTKNKKAPDLPYFPKRETLFFFYFFSTWQRKYGCKCYPALNQITSPFKKKSKQIGLKEANCMALLFSTFEMKANTAIEALLTSFPSST